MESLSVAVVVATMFTYKIVVAQKLNQIFKVKLRI